MPHINHAVLHVGTPAFPYLDLDDSVGQRSATFTYALSDGVNGELKGNLTPLRESAPTITHNTTATIKRTVTLALGVEDSARVNPVRDRVDIAMLLKGVAYPLGRYLFVDQTDAQWTSGNLASVSLMDEMFILDQPITRGFTGNDQLVVNAIHALLEDFPDIEIEMDSSGLVAVGSWAAGTSRATVLADLCEQGGFFRPWFDNHGVLRIIKAFEPADKQPDIDLDVGNRVIRGTIANSSDLLTAPNRFVVISNGPNGDTDAVVVGTYDVPASAPHSIANRGFVVANVQDIQLNSPDQAFAVARTIGISSTVFQRVNLSTPPDPRHDSYNVILWQGQRWLEIGWTMSLIEGGAMAHTMRKAYE